MEPVRRSDRPTGPPLRGAMPPSGSSPTFGASAPFGSAAPPGAGGSSGPPGAAGSASGLPGDLAAAFQAGGEMGRLISEYDWAASPIGSAPAAWPAALRAAVATMLASKAQIVMFWGQEYTALYNDAYAPSMGTKHPYGLGQPGWVLWGEIWEVLGPLLAGVTETGSSFWAADHPFLLERNGFVEETYFDVSYDPVRLDDGSVGGVLCIVNETTGRVLGQRRVRTLGRLGGPASVANDQDELGDGIARVLAEEPADLPLALLYLDRPGATPGPGEPEYELVSSAGVAPGAVCASRIQVGHPLDAGARARCLVADMVTAVPEAAAEQGLMLPIMDANRVAGALVLGVSRHLTLDRQYRDFCDLVAAQVSRAVTNLRAHEQERARADALAELDRTKNDFLSNVSHELRTPLTLILGPIEDELARPDAEPERVETMRAVHANALRLLKLVNTLLDFSRLESGRLAVTYQEVDLAAATAQVASTFRSAMERAGLEFEVDCPPLPEPVLVDPEMWEKVVLNLLSNALKYTLAGRVRVVLRAEAGGATLQVVDTGVGIPDVEQERLFDRFHRVSGSGGRSHEGTGIGLALVRELVELHGGTVGVGSQPGQGSTFTVTLRFGRDHLPPEQVARAASEGDTVPGDRPLPTRWRAYVDEADRWLDSTVDPAEATVDPADSTVEPSGGDGPPVADRVGTGRGRILIVDDNADLRAYLTRLLRPYWRVVTAADGEQALAVLGRDEPIDLVISDVMMPGVDGFELVGRIRSDPAWRAIPVVLLSARAGVEASVDGLGAGADDYVAKPFTARELVARVRTNLELGQLRTRAAHQLRGIADAAIMLAQARRTPEVIQVAAEQTSRLVGGPAVVELPAGRYATADAPPGGTDGAAVSLVGSDGSHLGELRAWPGGLAGAAERSVLVELARLLALRLENARLYEAEHRIAATLQHSLLPRALPQVPGVFVAARYLPGSSEAAVGGDWYDAALAPDGELVLVIGDVVGKGVLAAAAMGQLRNALRAYVLEGFAPGDSLTRLNRLVDTLGRGLFATVACVCVDPATGRVRFASAGHPPPLVGANGRGMRLLHEAALGPPIGAQRNADYPTLDWQLDPGARLLLYTDGLVEHRDRDVDAALAELVATMSGPVGDVEEMVEMAVGTAAEQDRRDDIAVLAVELTEPRRFSHRLPIDATRLSVLRRRVNEFLLANGVDEDDVFDVTIAISEAAANAIEHPVQRRDDTIVVELALAHGVVQATVRDTGEWKAAGSSAYRGRGLSLIRALAEFDVETGETGTTVTLRRRVRLREQD